MLKIGIIISSTRPGRKGEAVAQWVHSHATKRAGVEYEIVDLLDYDLPHLDEALPAGMGQYAGEHTKKWAAKVAEFDGYIFVVAEYNHSYPGVLKSAIDFVFAEWNNKAASFVSYGVFGGARAVDQLRLALAQLQVAATAAHVGLSLSTDFENYTTLAPSASQEAGLEKVFEQVESWSTALAEVRGVDLSDEAAA